MYMLAKTFRFSASHQLLQVAEDHPCRRLHGHNYTVTVVLSAESTDAVTGMIVDYHDLAPLKSYIAAHLDHRHLNDVSLLNGSEPTAENLAHCLYEWCHLNCVWGPLVTTVYVSETADTFAAFTEGSSL